MRLIDADELLEHAWRDKLDSRELIAEMIENAPTVKDIPIRIPIKMFEQEPVIDRIRAEIRALSNANPSYWHSGDMVERDDVLEILDKYKAESEEKQ